MKYKRYMVFVSEEYDNPDPFDCVTLHTNDKDEALRFSDGSYLTLVFDREDGIIIKKVIYESNNTNR